MSMLKPTIVFVTGAWHGPHLYTPLTGALEAAGYTVKTPYLPSIGGKQDTFDEDVTLIRETISSTVEAGNDVVVLMHSYGGIAGGEAVKGFGRLDRTSGSKRGSVVRMIYLAAFALSEGTTLIDAIGGKPAPWFEAAGDKKQWKALDCHNIFYNDVEKEKADAAIEQLEYQAQGVMTSKVTYAAWKHIDSTYIICDKDNAIPPEGQEMMAKQPGSKMTVERVNASHSPFLSKLEDTVKLVRKAIGEQV